MDRRRFLKYTSGAAAGGALGSSVSCSKRKKLAAAAERQEVPTTCELCPNKCSVIAVVENGVIRKLNPNPENPKSRGMLCARGNAGLLQVYDPDRLKRPLIRAGERGEGKWREVSWEEALDYTAARLSAIKEKYGPEGVLWSSTEAFAEVFFKNLGLAFGSPNIVRHPTLCLASVNLAYSVTFGTVPSFDLLNANYVIMAGANRFESLITPDTMDLIESTMNRKTRLICLDPRFTVTASKADEWYPVRSEEHTSELQSPVHLVCRLLLEKKNKTGTPITSEYLDEVPREEWFEIRLGDETANSQLEQAAERLKLQRKAFEKRLDDKKAKITAGDDLAPGVLKMVKVYLAVKRRVQPGDKMAGLLFNMVRLPPRSTLFPYTTLFR